MELAQQCLMSMKRRELLTRPLQLYTNFSWEEKAFADDTLGVLGGIVWPPRSYLCSFCNREFRSAQALGGHMNVHRRDRARLKQSLVTATTTNAAAASEVQVLQHQNPKFSIPVQLTVRSSVSSAISSTKENRVDGSSVPCQIHSFLAGKGSFDVLLGPKEEPIRDPVHGPRETKLSVGLNNSVSGAGTSRNGEMSFKRHKTSSSSPLSLFLKPCSNVGYMEDLDLELRLGDPPKEK